MINALEKSDNSPNCQHELMKASEKLSKALNEADIRLLGENISNKSSAEMYVSQFFSQQDSFSDR